MKWETVKLGDVMNVKHGYAFDGKFFADSGDYILLTPGNCNESGGLKLKGDKEKYYVGEFPTEFLLSEGDMLVVMTDLINTAPILGGSFIIPESNRFLHNQRLGLVQITDEQRIDKTFLYYLLNTHGYRAQVRGSASGATVRHTAPGRIKDCTVNIPRDVKRQRQIGEAVSAYDELMENNRRRMGLLEDAARMLYQEWFVCLRFPGHERIRIVHGLPAGWTRKPLEEIAEFRLGKMLDQQKNQGDLMPYLANVNVRWGEFDLRDLREMRFKHDELETFGLKFGDIVMCEGGEPGRCAIWKEQMPGIMIQKALHRIRCREGMDYGFLYHNLRYQGQSGHLAALFTGATIKHLPREKLAKVTIVVPPNRLMELFSSYARPIEDQIKLLEAANRRASEARDLLLPRLMSGEIEV